MIKGERTILADKRILFVSQRSWADTREQHLLVDMLAEHNEVIWINPFGGIGGALFPDMRMLKKRLTVYSPGINLLPLPALRAFNNWRRLLQVKMYLLEKDFEPDLIVIDDPYALNFARHFKNKGQLVVYYAGADKTEIPPRSEEDRLAQAVDLVITASPDFYRRLKESGKAHLVKSESEYGGEELDEEEIGDEAVKAYMEGLEARLEKISAIIKKKLTRK